MTKPRPKNHRTGTRRDDQENVTVDWTLRESVQANMRIKVRQVLRKHGNPPDKAQKATDTVIQQAELLSEEWAPA